MSRGFVKDGDQEEIPMVAPRAHLPEGIPNYVTPSGLEALQNELKELTDRKKATDDRITANWLGAQIVQLEERLGMARLQPVQEDCSKVAFGHWVRFSRGKATQTVRIVGVDEADASRAQISFLSPLAKSLYGHAKGDMVAWDGPKGQEFLNILDISATAIETEQAPAIKPEATFAAMPETPKKVHKPLTATNEQSKSDEKPKAQPQLSEDPMERLPIVNERGITIGSAARFQVHDGSKLLHPVVHLQLYNSRGDLYLQKRPEWKKTQPGKWDSSVGGHIGFGEKPDKSVVREMEEELGITGPKPKFVRTYIMESQIEKEYVHLYTAVWDGPINPTAETDGGRFWTREELKDALGKGIFTPDLEKYVKSIL